MRPSPLTCVFIAVVSSTLGVCASAAHASNVMYVGGTYQADYNLEVAPKCHRVEWPTQNLVTIEYRRVNSGMRGGRVGSNNIGVNYRNHKNHLQNEYKEQTTPISKNVIHGKVFPSSVVRVGVLLTIFFTWCALPPSSQFLRDHFNSSVTGTAEGVGGGVKANNQLIR